MWALSKWATESTCSRCRPFGLWGIRGSGLEFWAEGFGVLGWVPSVLKGSGFGLYGCGCGFSSGL